jgi:hypothetical protein
LLRLTWFKSFCFEDRHAGVAGGLVLRATLHRLVTQKWVSAHVFGAARNPRVPVPNGTAAATGRGKFLPRSAPPAGGRTAARVGLALRGTSQGEPLHHWDSQGSPSPSPSIRVSGQLRMKNLASSHELICEQYLRPSQV